MTERLSTLMHDEAAGLHVPAPPVDEVLAGGRAIRRRRRTRVALGSAVAALAVVAAGAAVLNLDRPDTPPQPAKLSDRAAYEQLGAWAAGHEVNLGNHTATVEGAWQLQYTSAGVVVAFIDGYVLLTPEGVVEPLHLDLLDSSPARPAVATDPTSANIAYVRALDGDRAQPVVRDLATGDETTVGKPFRATRWAGVDWISGDLMGYYRNGEGRVVDWRTATPSHLTQPGWKNGSGVSIDIPSDGIWTLRSFAGDVLLTVPADPASTYGTLSPDGRFFAVSGTEPRISVYELATGEEAVIEGRSASDYGWSPDGHLVGRSPLSSSQLEICDPTTGECKDAGATATGELTLVTGIPGAAL